MARTYELKQRAERQAETRRRIVEAAIELHRTIGPARTTISDIARRAGVQRHTVYSHFPEERDVHLACSSLYIERNPIPDEQIWREVHEPDDRLRRGLGELYAYYERNEEMLAAVLRDSEVMPLVREIAQLRFGPRLAAMRDVLAEAFRARGRRRERLLAAVELAIDFRAWQVLVRRRGLDRTAAVETMVRAVTTQ